MNLLRSILVLVLCSALPAQVIKLANHSGSSFDGWKRLAVDVMPPHTSGKIGDVEYVVGLPTGKDTVAIDVKCTLAPGQRRTVNLADAADTHFQIAPPGGTALELWGGPILLDGRSMQSVSVEIDGAAYVSHLRRRTGRTFCVDLWVYWYPGQPWAEAEVQVTASNPAVTDLFEIAPPIELRFGNALVVIPWRGVGVPLVPVGEEWADGQARAFPLTFVWPNKFRGASDWSSVGSVADMAICAVGINKLLPGGNPVYPVGFNALQWTRQKLPSLIGSVHTWGAPAIDIAPNSGQTGFQEGQQFVRAESLLPSGVGAELACYLSALKHANRPSNFLEADGSQIVPASHPSLILWNGRPLFQGSARSPDMLGKLGGIAQWDVPGGWFGPDRQHRIMGGLAAAARITGKRAPQHLLENQARLWLMDYRTGTGNGTTDGPGAARAPFYEMFAAVLLHQNLRNRDLAAQIEARVRERITRSYLPAWNNVPGDIWHVLDAETILSTLNRQRYTRGWMPYQQGLGVWGPWIAGTYFDIAEARSLAVRGAEAVLRHGWRQNAAGRWIFWDFLGYENGEVLPPDQYVEGQGGHRTGWYETTWAVPGLAVLLENDPNHALAREIWDQVVLPNSWVPPGPR